MTLKTGRNKTVSNWNWYSEGISCMASRHELYEQLLRETTTLLNLLVWKETLQGPNISTRSIKDIVFLRYLGVLSYIPSAKSVLSPEKLLQVSPMCQKLIRCQSKLCRALITSLKGGKGSLKCGLLIHH